jgi:Domain of unknown function (DUF4190)
MWPFVAVPIAGLLLTVAGYVIRVPVLTPIGLILVILGVMAVIVGAATRTKTSSPRAQPIAYTDDGRPIYPVVGYTPEGTPITAERAVGYQLHNRGTNSLAVVALVLGFVFPLLAIPFGHVARSQIRATGEQGDGMALAGLILGYLSVIGAIVLIAIIAATLNG